MLEGLLEVGDEEGAHQHVRVAAEQGLHAVGHRRLALRVGHGAGHQGREHHHENKNLFHRIMYYSHSEQIEESL